MGSNVGSPLDVFKDITADGNEWDADCLAVPTRADLLESLAPLDEAGPQFLVAPVSSGSKSRVAERCRLDGGGRLGAGMQDLLARVKAKHRRRSGAGLFERPEQMVLQGDGREQRNTIFSSRPMSGTCLVPVSKVKPLQSTGLLLTEERLQDLHDHLPLATRLASRWKLIYCPAVHGVSLKAFFRQCQNWPGETLMLARDHNDVVFGGFASHTWRPSYQDVHFGAPECFVFTYGRPEEARELAVYPWAGGDMHFMFADSTGFGMGGGNGYAFWIGEDLLIGSSVPSQTFATSEPLTSQTDFVITTFECWSFDRGTSVQAEDPGPGGLPAGDDSPGVPAGRGRSPRSPDSDRMTGLREDALRFEAFC